jgi:hypothetical protein
MCGDGLTDKGGNFLSRVTRQAGNHAPTQGKNTK